MRVRRALVSVADSQRLAPFVARLRELRVEVLASRATARALREQGVDATTIAELTGLPARLDAVETLHPHVHAALVAGDTAEDDAALAAMGTAAIDLVAVNFRAVEPALARADATADDVLARIDLDGPA